MEMPVALPATLLSSTVMLMPAAAVLPVVSTLMPTLALLCTRTFFRITLALPDAPVGWMRMPPPVAPLPLSAMVVLVT
jgi:hypothetical protein